MVIERIHKVLYIPKNFYTAPKQTSGYAPVKTENNVSKLLKIDADDVAVTPYYSTVQQ